MMYREDKSATDRWAPSTDWSPTCVRTFDAGGRGGLIAVLWPKGEKPQTIRISTDLFETMIEQFNESIARGDW